MSFVVGVRDADVWAFTVRGSEQVGGIGALALVREPGKPYDRCGATRGAITCRCACE